jgi:hypothetical protein
MGSGFNRVLYTVKAKQHAWYIGTENYGNLYTVNYTVHTRTLWAYINTTFLIDFCTKEVHQNKFFFNTLNITLEGCLRKISIHKHRELGNF